MDVAFHTEIDDVDALRDCDLFVGADGVNSKVRARYADVLRPTVDVRKSRYMWLGSRQRFDAFTFSFRENEHGVFQIHAYQFDTPFMTGSNGILGAGVLAAALALAVMVVTFLFAAIFRRVSILGFWTVLIGLAAVLAAVALLVIRNIGWSGIGDWFLTQTALSGATYLLGTAVLTGILGYVILRRDTPRAG